MSAGGLLASVSDPLVPASGRPESARSSVFHGLRGNLDLHSRWANAVTSCLVITTPLGLPRYL
jgi:hypothetical protein